MELTDYVRVLRKRWVSIVALMALALAGAAAATLLATPQYQAQTQLFVSTSATSSITDVQTGNALAQARVQSYAPIVTSDRVLSGAITSLGLKTTPAQLAPSITADNPLNTVLINITVTNRSARQAAAIANAVGASFITVVDALEKPLVATATTPAVSPVSVSTVETADTPSSPASPDVLLNLALGLLVGLAVGVAVAVLRETLDTTVRSERDIARFGVPVLAGMPYDSKAKAMPLVVQDDPRSIRAENFRHLRTNLQFATAAGDARSVVITSSVGGEGKTTTAANLAITLASAGTRVALVDADLRRPSIAEYLQIEGSVGLTTVLVGRASLADVLQPWGDTGNLTVLTAGEIPPNPSELLASDAMGKLLRELESSYDVVLLDGAPLLPVTDSAILAEVAGGALVVVGSGRTTRPSLERSFAALHAVDARILGTVITMMPTKGGEAHYSYSYAYRSNGRGVSEPGHTQAVSGGATAMGDAAQVRPESTGSDVKPVSISKDADKVEAQRVSSS